MKKPESITVVKYYDFPQRVPKAGQTIEHENGVVYINSISSVDYTLKSATGEFIGLEVTFEGVFFSAK